MKSSAYAFVLTLAPRCHSQEVSMRIGVSVGGQRWRSCGRGRRVAIAASVVTALASAVAGRAASVPLLGAGANWRLNDWRQVTDGVRGGASTSDLKAASNIGVEFMGHLDTASAPAGKGFAGVSYRVEALPRELNDGLRGLCVDVAECDGLEYSLQLGMRGTMAGTAHRYRFQPTEPGPIEMPFKDFEVPVRRQPAPPAPKLDLDRVETLTLQVESAVPGTKDKQDGRFSLKIRGVSGLLGDAALNVEPAQTNAERWTCKACDTVNPPANNFCMRCGANRKVEEIMAAAKAKAASEGKVKWSCDGCGAKNFPAATECHKCGAPRG